jgi:NTP pyrophosphatase (non-canonical NTP hydrolase)
MLCDVIRVNDMHARGRKARKKDTGGAGGKTVFLDGYQTAARRTDQNTAKGLEGLAFPLLGIFGEVGTLLSALKKKQRDRDSYVGYSDAVLEEFGDVLWYFSNIASRASLDLSVLAQRVYRKLEDWGDVEVQHLATFDELPRRKGPHGSPNSSEFEQAVIVLAGKVGLLLNDFSLGRIERNRDVLSAHLVEIFRALIEAANMANVDLQTAAARNVEKVNSRWPRDRVYAPLFDERFRASEQLPRRIELHITEEEMRGRLHVVQRWKGVKLGNSLTDNKLAPDDYRFHDVFHLAYAAILGWSPVIRALLKTKRKSEPEVDEAQDGARAILIEEGVSTLIFHHALRLNYFAAIKSLDYPLLKTVQDFVRGFEVEKCPLWQWEKAILDGFHVFRRLRAERGGIVVADLQRHAISFRTASK